VRETLFLEVSLGMSGDFFSRVYLEVFLGGFLGGFFRVLLWGLLGVFLLGFLGVFLLGFLGAFSRVSPRDLRVFLRAFLRGCS
jgi:fluoride ion exporter CrcB/FEX